MNQRMLAGGLAAMAVAALSACGVNDAAPPPEAATVTVTVTQPQDVSGGSGTTGAAAAASAEPDPGSSSTFSASEAFPTPSPTGAVPPPGLVTWHTFQRPDPKVWSENTWDVANQREKRGLRTDLSFPCYDDTSAELEIRTGSRYSNLRFLVGQALDSGTSTHTMTVRFLTDNQEVEIKRVPSNKVVSFDRNITNVGAVRIQFSVDLLPGEDQCTSGSPVSPVLFDGYLQ